MTVFLVYAHVTSVEDRDLYTHMPCNHLNFVTMALPLRLFSCVMCMGRGCSSGVSEVSGNPLPLTQL